LNQNEIYSKIINQEKRNEIELSKLDRDEFVLSHKQISSQSSPKRKLEYSNEEKARRMLVVLILNIFALHFTLTIAFSFLVDKNECCRKKFDDTYCSLFALCISKFFIAYLIAKFCGKHISRYVGITLVMLISVTNCILTGIFQSSLLYNQSMMISIIVITALISIINFLGMLLPNLTFCPSLRYEEKTFNNLFYLLRFNPLQIHQILLKYLIIQYILLLILPVDMIVIKEIFILILMIILFH